MPDAKELSDRIESIEETMKITKAMYLISSTKLRKVRRSVFVTKKYIEELEKTERVLAYGIKDRWTSSSGEERIMVITSDKGLAGSYNHNVIKETERICTKNPDAKIYAIGEIGRNSFLTKSMNIDESFDYSSDKPTLHQARKIAEDIIERVKAENIGKISVVYTDYISGTLSEVKCEQLLPIIPLNDEKFEFYPDKKKLFDETVFSYLESKIYGYLSVSFCSEQNSRMIAMDAAGRNADKLLSELNSERRKLRQGAITGEVTEITAGARAQKKSK